MLPGLYEGAGKTQTCLVKRTKLRDSVSKFTKIRGLPDLTLSYLCLKKKKKKKVRHCG